MDKSHTTYEDLGLTKDQAIHYLKVLEELERRHKYNKLAYLFPEKGPLNRYLYPKQMEFFSVGAKYKERAVLGANRSGKSLMTKYEVTLHLTGLYPSWWTGKRFAEPTKIWCACETHDLVRDVAQTYLLGEINDLGSGLIPKDRIIETRAKPGIPNAISEAIIKWGDRPNQYSTIGFKSYVQGRESFQGVALHQVDFDEEPPSDIYSEALTRTMTTGGIVTSAFTPYKGMTDLTKSFLPEGKFPKNGEIPGTSRFVMSLSWEEAPHLSDADKKALIATYQPYEIEARTKGIPTVGVGRIYSTLEADFVIDPIKLPPNWPRMYSMDVGWKVTAALFGAFDPDSKTLYIYDEYRGQESFPEVHAAAIRARAGTWMYGAIDPASQQGNQKDGSKLIHEYSALGLNLRVANNAVDAGITRVTNLLSIGKIRVFSTCSNMLHEYRQYHRNDRGEVVKKDDHFMDCFRYMVMTMHLASIMPDENDSKIVRARQFLKEMNHDDVTGY